MCHVNLTDDHKLKVRECLDTLYNAQMTINRAAEILCDVPGFADEWSQFCEPYAAVKRFWHTVNSRLVFFCTQDALDEQREEANQ